MSLKKYRKLAIESYGTALQTFAGESNHSRDVYRLISMWFRNCDSMDDINIDDTLQKYQGEHRCDTVGTIISFAAICLYSMDSLTSILLAVITLCPSFIRFFLECKY